ncbi:type II secretion system protein M [Aliikangiella sp. G2MR2-5]|uniref:type II secretion system protein M n=1 Tax=Aliikangiella sp. G2MR2-5 TaxID=2788943 RepID=UPI0018A9AA39|nr:type II secretion system protein M [Aliikangiella sp. G2MR2-5]
MEQLKQWFESLDEKEQKLVLVLSVFILLVMIFFALVKPINDQVGKLESKVKGQERIIAQWSDSIPKILASGGRGSGATSSQSLSSVVTASTRQFNLRVSRVQEKNSGELQVWFDNVPFNDFMNWIGELGNRYKVSVASVNIRSKDRNGLISIDVKLRKG